MAHIPPTSSAVSCDPRQMLKVTFLKGPSIVSSCEIPRHSTNTMAPVPSAPVNVTIALFYRDFSISRLCACLSASVCLLYFAVLFFCLLDIFSVIVSVSAYSRLAEKIKQPFVTICTRARGGGGQGRTAPIYNQWVFTSNHNPRPTRPISLTKPAHRVL